MKRLTFRPEARVDLDGIADHIFDYDPDRAFSFVAELEARAAVAAARPLSFPAREDASPGLRYIPYRRYLIFFRVTDEDVIVTRIVHGKRDLRNLELG